MTSTYTPSLKVQLMGNGDQSGTWGTTTNTNLELFEEAIAGVKAITMSNADYTLTNLNGISDEARNMVIVAGGTISATYQIIAPLEPKIYIVVNNTIGGYAITFGGATGYVVTIPNGYTTLVYGDGTNFYSGTTTSSDDFTILGGLDVTGATVLNSSLSVSGNTILSGSLVVSGGTNIVPVGSTFIYPVSTMPNGFLLCNGQAVSRGTYAALFALIGTNFGPGDGVTTFNIPNISGSTYGVYYMIKY